MGAYNILKLHTRCENCNAFLSINIQFKFGDTWLIEYVIGEKIKWGGADIGVRDLNRVKVYGISGLEKCKACGNTIKDEYDIIIESDIIKYVRPLANLDDYDAGGTNYALL